MSATQKSHPADLSAVPALSHVFETESDAALQEALLLAQVKLAAAMGDAEQSRQECLFLREELKKTQRDSLGSQQILENELRSARTRETELNRALEEYQIRMDRSDEARKLMRDLEATLRERCQAQADQLEAHDEKLSALARSHDELKAQKGTDENRIRTLEADNANLLTALGERREESTVNAIQTSRFQARKNRLRQYARGLLDRRNRLKINARELEAAHDQLKIREAELDWRNALLKDQAALLKQREDAVQKAQDAQNSKETTLNDQKNQLDHRDKNLRLYSARLGEQRRSFNTLTKKLAQELASGQNFHPLRDYLGLTEIELSKLELQLKKTPTLSSERPALELALTQMLEQRDFLRSVIDASRQEYQKHSGFIMSLTQDETLLDTPPPPPVRRFERTDS